jgi:hypothetical protein
LEPLLKLLLLPLLLLLWPLLLLLLLTPPSSLRFKWAGVSRNPAFCSSNSGGLRNTSTQAAVACATPVHSANAVPC